MKSALHRVDNVVNETSPDGHQPADRFLQSRAKVFALLRMIRQHMHERAELQIADRNPAAAAIINKSSTIR